MPCPHVLRRGVPNYACIFQQATRRMKISPHQFTYAQALAAARAELLTLQTSTQSLSFARKKTHTENVRGTHLLLHYMSSLPDSSTDLRQAKGGLGRVKRLCEDFGELVSVFYSMPVCEYAWYRVNSRERHSKS